MIFSPLTSIQVLEFLPMNTWTEIDLLPSCIKNVYIATTKDRKEKQKKDMQSISLQSGSYDRVTKFKLFEIVAVQINGDWFRGKLISFNEFQTDNTRIELIDEGSVYSTKLENLFVLPYYFTYEPLALPITFKNFIPKTTTYSIKPLLSESNLYEGVVFVDVNCKDTKLENALNEKQQLKSKKDFNSANDSKIIVQKMTNGHNKSFDDKELRNDTLFSREKLNYVPIKNKDCCIITFFEDLTSLYVGKAMKQPNYDGTMIYDFCDLYLVTDTNDGKDKILKYDPAVGDLVKVFSSSNQGLFRAKILKNNTNGSYDVFYIDYGNIETVSSNVIYELADELKKPGIAVKIGLSDLKNIQITNKIKTMFEEFCESGKPFMIELNEKSDNCLENVKLKDIENGLYINYNYIMKCTSIQSEPMPVQIDENTSIIHNNITKHSELKNNDTVFLKHFEDMDSVYIVKDVKLYNDMMIQLIEDKNAVCENNFTVGDIVTIVLKKGKYRAKIKEIDANMIKVKYIDIGSYGFVESNSVRKLSAELLKVPRLALKIGIKEPFIKKTSELANFIRKNEASPLYLEFDECSPNRYQEITLRTKNSKNIFEEFLKLNKNQLISNDISNNCKNNETIIKSNESLINDFQNITLESGDYCIVSYFKDFENIYLCKAVKNPEDNYEMHNLSIVLRTMASEDRTTKINPVIGDIVKVLSPSFLDFFRAKILNIDNDNIQVSYIDFGNTEIIHPGDIFELSDELNDKTKLPTRVSIEVPPNAKKTDEIDEFFTGLIENNEVLCIENNQNSNGSEKIILKQLKSGKSVNTELLKLLPVEKISNKNDENSTHFGNVKFSDVSNAHDSENVKILKETMDKTTECVQLKIEEEHTKSPNVINNEITFEPLTNGEVVNLTYFHDSTSVFVIRSSAEYLKLFEDVITRTYKDNSNRKKLNIEVGDIVKTMFEGSMYRAKILKIVNQNSYNIFFIDFGNDKIVDADEIFELPEDLKKIPGFCFKIGTKRSPIIGNELIKSNDLVEEYLKNIGESLYIEYDEGDPNGLKDASLKNKNNCDVFDELYKMLDKPVDTKVEESIQKTQNQTVLINSTEPEVLSNIELRNDNIVFCTHFEDFNHLYLCKGSKNSSIPENYSVIINSTMAKDIVIKKNPKYLEIVRVKYEENIFRAKVLNKCGEEYSVFLIDIGKCINVLADDVFELPNSLRNIPALAQRVGLKETKGLKITSTIKDYFYNLWYNDPVPLILKCDEGNFNFLNEVILIKQSDELNIINDLFKLSNTLDNTSNKPKPVPQITKTNGSNINIGQMSSGDHVEILYANSFDIIYVRHVMMYEDFKNIIEHLKKENRENFKPIVTTPKVNDIVAVYSTKQNGIFRARVIGQGHYEDAIKCSIIDFAQIDMISSKNIFTLPNHVSLNKVPIMVHRVSLAGLNKTVISNNNKITSYLTSLKGKICVIEYDKKVERGNKVVVLKELQSSLTINDEVQKLLTNDNSSLPTSQQRRLERKIIMPETKESTLEKSSHRIKSGSSVCITHFENFNSIFIRETSYEFIENFNSFNKQMLKYYRNANNCTKEKLKIGDKVCVKSLLNVIMYSRAIIIDINDNKYNVFYLDYGNTEIVNSEDIMDLPKELEKYQDFIIKVGLQNMPRLNGKNELQVIKNHLNKNFIIPNATLSIEFNEFNPKGLEDVILRTEFYNKDIVEGIRHLLNAPPINIKTTGQNQNKEQQNSHQGRLPYPARRQNN